MASGNSTTAEDKPVGVTLLAGEWGSSKGGLSTLNRELAKQLAQVPGINVSLLVPECSEGEKTNAFSHGVTLFQAQKMVGMEPVTCLSFPPKELHIDVVIGHGQKLGPPAQVIKQSHDCTWVHVVHTASEELAMFKIYPTAISHGEKKQETEVQLCSKADLVVAIGPKLTEACSAPLRPYGKDVFDLTPGIYEEFKDLKQVSQDLRKFRVLVFGRGDPEDFELKGYDIAAKAVAALDDQAYHLIFVGAPSGKEKEVTDDLLKHGISRDRLTVRSFRESREKLANLFCEADLAIMPSRTEGFGLTALEALSAGLPVLVSANSGFGEALKKIEYGSSWVVDSEETRDWAQAIRSIRQKDRKLRLKESRSLLKSYSEEYDWKKQCEALVEKMLSISHVKQSEWRGPGLPLVPSDTQGPRQESVPGSVLARGEEGMAAYRRAVLFGSTLDKRVKVLLVGQDRVGKTSVGRTLKGEKFNENEPSTEGVLMNKPLKNVSQQAWQNSELHKDTSVYDHKCAEYVSRDLTRSPDHSVKEPTEEYATAQTDHEEATKEPTGKPNFEQNKLPNTLAQVRPNDRAVMEAPRMDKETGTAESTLNTPQHVPEQEEIVMPDQVARLVENNLQEHKTDSGEGIWPVIWDFAGQAVYRAIHPIFLSPETVYILVFDLRKKLSDKAHSYVKRDGCDEKEVTTSDYNDTNLDHIMRWMDLIHSLKTVPKGLPDVASPHGSSPPVIMVGTHADSKDVDHKEKMNILMEKLSTTKEFKKHIVDKFALDNTRAGQPKDQEDPAVKDLRDVILKEANKMPYTQNEVPLQWLAVENKISETARQGLKYVTKKEFKEKIASGICRFEEENDIEVLLHFLHDRGSILYHDRADNSDGLVVLDPQWLTKVLCEILKVEPKDREPPIIADYRKDLENKGILAKELLDYACTELGVDGIKEYLLDLMKKFNLIYSYKDKRKEDVYLVPCMATAKPVEETICTSSKDLPPLFLTFKTKYVPCGLFSRLVLLFAEWAKSQCRILPELYANAATFRVGRASCLGFSCYKSVIKFFIWTQDNSDPLKENPDCCLEVLRCLEDSLDTLREECHWLHSCSWDLCVQCNLCRGILATKSGDCYWHDEKECFHDDCAHYVDIPLSCEPLCCERLDNKRDARLSGGEKFEPWIKAFTKLRDAKNQENPKTCSGHEVQPNSATESPKVKEGTPLNEELEEVAEDIGDAWKKLGRRLEFEEATLTGFHKQHDEYSEKAYGMLLAWKRKEGASYQVLNDALRHRLVGRADLATTFCCVERL